MGVGGMSAVGSLGAVQMRYPHDLSYPDPALWGSLGGKLIAEAQDMSDSRLALRLPH